jgi:putative oxidoreductase
VAKENQMKETSDAQRRTSNIEALLPNRLDVGWSDVGRWAFSVRVQFIWRIVPLIIGAIFIYAGAIKALDPVQFAHDIDNYKILPWTIGVGLAFYLPWLEIFCGLALIFRVFYYGALSVLSALTSIFLIATVAAKVRGLDITCGCFGHASQNWSFPQHMAVDLGIFAALAVLLWIELVRRERHDQKTQIG